MSPMRTAALALVLLLHAAPAGALEFTLLSEIPTTIELGETLTIDLAVDNLSESPVQGISASVTGMGGGLIATAGRTASFHFAAFCQNSTLCFGALDTVNGAFFAQNYLPGSGDYTQGDDSIVVIKALGLAGPSRNTGAHDPGIDGTARDVTLELTGVAVGVYSLQLQGTVSDGESITPLSLVLGSVQVIPEPGTAMLLGFGLAGLGTLGRPKTLRRREPTA